MIKRLTSSALCACTLGWNLSADPASDHQLTGELTKIANRFAATSRGHLGYRFLDLQTGTVLAERNPNELFIPASNVKLFTTAMALVQLGPNYTFETQLRTTAAPTPRQTVLPDLQIVGGGDPNLSGRALPYQVHAPEGDPLGALKNMADTLVQSGIREIDGEITGLSMRYPGDQLPDGWTIDDSTYGYGAPVTSLALNDNLITVTLRPTSEGNLAELELSPATDTLVILNEVVTDNSSTTSVQVRRIPGTEEIVLWGTLGIRAASWSQDVAVPDPALFAAEELTAVLREKGVVVRGSARSRYLELDDLSTSSNA